MSECPPPRVPGRPAEKHEMPTAAQRISQAAEMSGWTVSATYAEGPLMGVGWKHLGDVRSLALRMTRGRQRCVALWQCKLYGLSRRWMFDTAYAWLAAQRFWPEHLNASELRKYITQPANGENDVTSSDERR